MSRCRPPVRGPLRSRSSPSQGRRRPRRSPPWLSRRRRIGAEPAGDDVVLLCFPCIKPSPPVFFLCSTAPSSPPSCHCFFEPEVSLANPFTLLWNWPSSRGWNELVSSLFVWLPAACLRHRIDPPSPESRPSSRAGRLQVLLPSSPRALLCLAVVSFLCSTCVAELQFAAGTHTAEHAPSSQGPAFLRPRVM
jgi:hypothetical protein